jgi:hydrogenase-4 component H
MFDWIKTALKAGNATVKYPFAPLEAVPDTRGKPQHNYLDCIACAACATACPPNAIQMRLDLAQDAYIWEINYGRCIFCGRCEEASPVNAIELTAEFELAVMCKDDLYESATYKLQLCSQCEKPYAPRKEIAYLSDLLASFELDDADITHAQDNLAICPVCRRSAEGANVKHISEQLERRA